MMTLIDLQEISKDIVFNKNGHVYTNSKGEKLTSVTTFLSLYKESFDPTGIIAYKCGQREGISKEEMQARWKKTSDVACEYGTLVHGQIEEYLKTGEIKDTTEKEIVEDFAKIKINGKIFSELRLKSDNYFLAGTCDIAAQIKNKVKIHDLKTNKEFTLKSKYSKKLLYPVNHLPDSHLHFYSLQILTYGEMVKEHGYEFEPGYILWVNPSTKKIEKFEVLDLRKECSDLLNHYKSNMSW